VSEARFYVGGIDATPALTLYGDGLPHETILTMMSGWHETPDQKSPVTERDSGDGAYDIDEESIAYSSRVAEFDYRLTASSRARMHVVRESVLLLAGRTVTVRVIDDDDDTFVVGTVSIGKDKSAQNVNAQMETGTITVEIRRPVRLSWSSRSLQLFPPASSGGGLSFGVPEYVRQWTGAVNASTSRLLDGAGNIIATNLLPIPRPGPANLGNTSITPTADGFEIVTNTTYTGNGDDHRLYPQNAVAGGTYHLHAETDDVLTTTMPDFSIYISGSVPNDIGVPKTYLSSPSVIDMDLPSTVNIWGISFKCGLTAGDHVTWRRLGLYTAADWQAMQEAGVTWFDGDSQSPRAYSGLSFPLGFGVVGSGGDTGLLVNGGSYRSSPVLTVSGSFSDGVLLEHDSGALSYDGPVGSVPLVLDCRTGTAHMGGVDVTRRMSRFDWPSVPAGGSLSLRLLSPGSGWVDVESRDAWM
jgi:hypothetical protein